MIIYYYITDNKNLKIMKDIIVCSKFILRKLKPVEDKESISENINDKDVLKTLPMNFPYTDADYEKFVKSFEEEENAIERDSVKFIIDVDGKAVGSVGLSWKLRDCSKHRGSIGYWLGKKYWGQGIMTEAIKVMCDIAFNELDKLKLNISALEDNIGSRRVAEKNGFKLEWTAVKEEFKEGKYKNLVCYTKFNNNIEL